VLRAARNMIRFYSVADHKENNHWSVERFYSLKKKQFMSHIDAERKKNTITRSHKQLQSVIFDFSFDDVHAIV
jgi:hypothetical protein